MTCRLRARRRLRRVRAGPGHPAGQRRRDAVPRLLPRRHVVVSYGELARVDDRVIFSMPVGGSDRRAAAASRHAAAALVDWARTESLRGVRRGTSSYAETRAEADYQRLTDEVAALLNDIALTTDRDARAGARRQARRTLARLAAQRTSAIGSTTSATSSR